MKKLFLLSLVALFAIPTICNAQGKWFVAGSLSANVVSVDGESAASAGLGVGIHRMLGDKFSVGVNLFYVGSEGSNAVEPDINFAYYGKLTDNLYYVPEVQLGIGYFTEEGVAAFGGGVSPFGLEFRPTRKLGFRVNILNLSYANLQGVSIFNFGIDPSLSLIYRF